MKICLCGHRDARHEELSARNASDRGACLACDCSGFDLPPEPPAPETALIEEQPAPVEEVVPDERLTESVPERVEGPAPAGVEEAPAIPPDSLLWFYNAFWCQCGSRAFERRQCCGSPMRAVRVEIHAREVR